MLWTQMVLKVLFTAISFIVLSGLCIFLVVRIQRALVVNNKREHVIKLTNQGNFTSIFVLTVASVEKMLSFHLTSNGVPLIPAPVLEFPAQAIPGQAGQAAARTAQKTGGQPGPNMGGALKGGQAVAAKAGLVATMLGTLGALLPGSLGSGLRAQSQALREAQTSTMAATQAPVNAQRRVEALQHESSKLGGGQAKPASTNTGGKTITLSQPASQPAAAAASPLQSSPSAPVAAPKATPGLIRVQTPPLAPGAGLSLVLRIGSPRQHYPQGSFTYTLSSEQQPVEPLDGAAQPVTRKGLVHFPHIALWRYWLAPLFNFLAIASLLFSLIVIFRFIWF
jgi:hypothetical protein